MPMTIRLTPELKKKLQEQAKKGGRTVNAEVNLLLEASVDREINLGEKK